MRQAARRNHQIQVTPFPPFSPFSLPPQRTLWLGYTSWYPQTLKSNIFQ